MICFGKVTLLVICKYSNFSINCYLSQTAILPIHKGTLTVIYCVKSYIIKFSLSVWLSVCMFVWNRLPNHAHYGDEAFAGDSVGLGLGQRLNFILKKTYFKVLLRQNRPWWKKYCLNKQQVLVNLYHEGDKGDQFDTTFINVELRASNTSKQASPR